MLIYQLLYINKYSILMYTNIHINVYLHEKGIFKILYQLKIILSNLKITVPNCKPAYPF